LTFADLGAQPLANSYLAAEQLGCVEPFYPLHAYVCEQCLLVQLESVVSAGELFTDYAYFSSYSDSWLDHSKAYAEMAVRRFELGAGSHVVEVASNDGYLLQYFMAMGIPVLGIEPAANVAEAAVARGIPTVVRFFGQEAAGDLVRDGARADLLIGNNVLAHVPDLNDFVAGLRLLLSAAGVVTMEFPHLMRLMAENQFDTIYHEHFSYFSLLTVARVFAAHGLRIFDVDELPTHGGSLRIYACHQDDATKPETARVSELKAREAAAGLSRIDRYLAFGEQVKVTKRQLLRFLVEARDGGKAVVGYGAPAKGNVLLNYCGVRTDLLDYTVDRSPHKQGRFLPGTHIPVYHPDRLRETHPDFVVILPWNLKTEVMQQMAHVRDWGGRFVTPIPEVRVHQ
jgi:hypothetical protein